MKLGLCASLYLDSSLNDVFNFAKKMGIEGLEIYSGGGGKSRHIDVDELLESDKALESYLDQFKKRGSAISTLNCAGNPIHPVKEKAEADHRGFERTVLLCEKMKMDKLVVFSGAPGGCPQDKTPNWIVCPWPDEYLEARKYQWEEVLVPYWTRAVAFAREHGVTKLAFEMHPGFCVYNPETLLMLRERVGPEIGANFDPSHLMWQGIDPGLAILELKGAVFSVHAKDVFVNHDFIVRNGPNDAKHYSDSLKRAWTFRTVGYGHSEETWRGIISALGSIGYDGFLNIEHEDLYFSRQEGVTKAAEFLRGIIIKEKPEGMWWA
ncbi:MAG: sugar phosphate isomerase/epimerase [Treponema sp.]|jgi:sugar phosphate isomerase/epimerase|nr:sugar phosphate isomerase/epimerase [Treponema sp.]